MMSMLVNKGVVTKESERVLLNSSVSPVSFHKMQNRTSASRSNPTIWGETFLRVKKDALFGADALFRNCEVIFNVVIAI